MNILVTGAGGFIGGHLCKRLKKECHYVVGVDIKQHEYFQPNEFCDKFYQGDLRNPDFVDSIFSCTIGGAYDEVYTLAADMGGAGYIFTGENDASVMHNSALININMVKAAIQYKVGRLFYSSSACIYPAYNQLDPNNPNCEESSAYPAEPDSEYGFEKLFSERLYKSFERNHGLNVRIARFHNIYGTYGSWNNGKEKSPAAICRKVAEAVDVMQFTGYTINNSIDIWGDGNATRSFLYIDEAVEGIIRLMRSDCKEIVNLGSEEMITINDLARMVIRIAGKSLTINNIPGPTGVRGRNSDNRLIQRELNWSPNYPLEKGMRQLYEWVSSEVAKIK